jgi:carbamoyl-phosphate synthase large subunit
MGHAAHFAEAFAKAQMAAGTILPTSGGALITVNDFDKSAAMKLARDLHRMGFDLYATEGTAVSLAKVGLPVTTVQKAIIKSATVVTVY